MADRDLAEFPYFYSWSKSPLELKRRRKHFLRLFVHWLTDNNFPSVFFELTDNAGVPLEILFVDDQPHWNHLLLNKKEETAPKGTTSPSPDFLYL
jgi:hypothetical protein